MVSGKVITSEASADLRRPWRLASTRLINDLSWYRPPRRYPASTGEDPIGSASTKSVFLLGEFKARASAVVETPGAPDAERSARYMGNHRTRLSRTMDTRLVAARAATQFASASGTRRLRVVSPASAIVVVE